jgi:hypothetical protein
MNISEHLFETWCFKNSWLYEIIPVETACTSDYRINISGITIYAEVKEILANDDEKKVIRQLDEGEMSDVYGEAPGKTIRKKVKDSYKQIKRFANLENCPGVLVLYNNSGLPGLGRLDHYHVLTGMFGLQTIPVTIPKDSSIQPIYGLWG